MIRQIEALSSYSPMSVCRFGAIFSLFTWSLVGEIGKWNFPIYLFGIVSHEMSGFVVYREFIHILFPSLFLDGFALLSSTSNLFSFILAALSLGLKLALYMSAKRVLLEKGGEAVNGFASLDPRRAMQNKEDRRSLRCQVRSPRLRLRTPTRDLVGTTTAGSPVVDLPWAPTTTMSKVTSPDLGTRPVGVAIRPYPDPTSVPVV